MLRDVSSEATDTYERELATDGDGGTPRPLVPPHVTPRLVEEAAP